MVIPRVLKSKFRANRLRGSRIMIGHTNKQRYFLYILYIYKASKKIVISGAWCKIVPFLCNSPVLCFFQYLNFFFGTLAPKTPRNFFSLKIKSSGKQNCVYILFLSNSKILKRLNHGISENQQNCNQKIRNFQFWSNLEKVM